MQPHGAMCGSWRDTGAEEETQGPPVAGHRARSKAGMKRREYVAPFFSSPTKKKIKALSSTKITLRCTSKATQIPKHKNK